jgi:hypothetical protein
LSHGEFGHAAADHRHRVPWVQAHWQGSDFVFREGHGGRAFREPQPNPRVWRLHEERPCPCGHCHGGENGDSPGSVGVTIDPDDFDGAGEVATAIRPREPKGGHQLS